MSEASEERLEAEAAAAPKVEARSPSGSTFGRVLEWLWRGNALREARAHTPYPALGQAELVRRGQLAAEAGRRLLEPSPPFEAGPADALALELYRQSIHWTLAAAGDQPWWKREEAAPAASKPLATVPDELLLGLSETKASFQELQLAFQETDFVAIAALSTDEQNKLAWRFRRLADALVTLALAPGRRVDELWFQRIWRLGGALSLLFALIGGGIYTARALQKDLALGRAWRASSSAVAACSSPTQDCPGEFFFHTAEEQEPWVEIDLARARKFSAVRIANRKDCCSARAAPLLVEVSSDRKRWTKVAQRSEDFETWTARFDDVTARYVRVRSPVRTTLHLRRVSVLE